MRSDLSGISIESLKVSVRLSLAVVLEKDHPRPQRLGYTFTISVKYYTSLLKIHGINDFRYKMIINSEKEINDSGNKRRTPWP